jgi:hypothetical protein
MGQHAHGQAAVVRVGSHRFSHGGGFATTIVLAPIP